MMTDTNILNKYIEKFEKLEINNFEKLELFEDEQVKHCIDDSNKKYNLFRWVVTSQGRVWSLSRNMWLNPRNQNGYWRIGNVYVHDLVNHFFSTKEDEDYIRRFDEHNKIRDKSETLNFDIHHKNPVVKRDSINMSKEERIQACMAVNHKENLIFQIKETDHKNAHRIMKGKKTLGEAVGVEQFDCFSSIIKNSLPDTVYYSFGENGNQLVHMTKKLKGMTPEEIKEWDMNVPHKFNIW